MKKFKGKVAVITGGNSGIGLATAIELHKQGADVVIFGRNKKTLAEAAVEVGDKCLAVQGDITNMEDIDRLYKITGKVFGKIDILFVNAGYGESIMLEDMTETNFDDLMDVNFKGPYFTVQRALPLLSSDASIIFNTSITHRIGVPGQSVYSACKAAQQALVKTLSAELVGKGIRVNAVCPGFIDTPILSRSLSGEELEGVKQMVTSHIPVKRFGRSEEVAKTVSFLASTDSSFILGEEIVVDGGQTMF